MHEKYVSKAEVKPLRRRFNMWMSLIHDQLKNKGISFTFMLVGSAKRNLVVRHHNKGFDCDYQIKITRNSLGLEAKEIKDLFRNSLNKVVKRDGYYDCENSTSSLTIKKKATKSSVNHSYDVVILMQKPEGLSILRCHKSSYGKDCYVFELLPDMSEARENFNCISGLNSWNKLRDIYYKKKLNELTGNRSGKKSFQLLNEAVNEVLQQRNV